MIIAFSNILSVASLVELNLSHNKIESVIGLYAAVNIEFLDLSFNRLKNIDGLETTKNMKHLRLANNLIASYKALRSISFHRNLRELDVSNNPIISPKNNNLKVKILQIAPSIQILNNTPVRNRSTSQGSNFSDNLKYASMFEKRRQSLGTSPLSGRESPSKGNRSAHQREILLEQNPGTVANNSQLSRFVIESTNDDSVLDVVNVEYNPPTSKSLPVSDARRASFSSPSLTTFSPVNTKRSSITPTRILNVVMTKSADKQTQFIIAAEGSADDIVKKSPELLPAETSTPEVAEEILNRRNASGGSGGRAPSRLPWRNPPNPLPRPKKFEKKTQALLEAYERERLRAPPRVSTPTPLSSVPWVDSHNARAETRRQSLNSNPNLSTLTSARENDLHHSRQRSAGDVFREILSAVAWDDDLSHPPPGQGQLQGQDIQAFPTGHEGGWQSDGDGIHYPAETEEWPRYREPAEELPPPPPPPIAPSKLLSSTATRGSGEGGAGGGVESLKQKLRAKYGMPHKVDASSSPSSALIDENDFSHPNSVDELEADNRSSSRLRNNMRSSHSHGSNSSHSILRPDKVPVPEASVTSPSSLYDDSALREIESRRQEILSKLLNVGQSKTLTYAGQQSPPPKESPKPVPASSLAHNSSSGDISVVRDSVSKHTGRAESSSTSPFRPIMNDALPPQISDSARLYLQKLSNAEASKPTPAEVKAPSEEEKAVTADPTNYSDVSGAIELLKQRKRDSLRMLR